MCHDPVKPETVIKGDKPSFSFVTIGTDYLTVSKGHGMEFSFTFFADEATTKPSMDLIIF